MTIRDLSPGAAKAYRGLLCNLHMVCQCVPEAERLQMLQLLTLDVVAINEQTAAGAEPIGALFRLRLVSAPIGKPPTADF